MQFTITVISTPEFERLVAEVRFNDKDVGLIISQEQDQGASEISIFSFKEGGRDAFEDGNYLPGNSLELATFLQAIAKAQERLALLDWPRET